MYLGLDIGTSSVKALIIDENQTIIGSRSAPLEISRPQSGWSEQNPENWILATNNAIAQLKSDFGGQLATVKGIGLSGQMHGATLLDKADQILRPCILWNDVRSHKEAAQLDINPIFRKISGNIVFQDYSAELLWVKNNEGGISVKLPNFIAQGLYALMA